MRVLVPLLVLIGVALPGTAVASVNGTFASSAADKGKLASVGFNTVTVNPYVADLDALAAHNLKGVVWLGGYTNAPTCQFVENDAWITAHVNAIKNHPAIVAYQVDNEPHATECPNAPAQIRARAALVRSLDPNPGHATMLAIYRDYDFAAFVGATDILRVGMYPCSHKYGCNYKRITEKVAMARSAGWTRLWGSPQAFGNDYYRMPTRSELQTILKTWRAAGVTDLLAYNWDKGEPVTLSTHPELWSAFAGS